MKRIMLSLVLSVVLIAGLPVSAQASGLTEGRVVFGGSFTLDPGEVLDGDLIVIGGNADLQPGSTVDGDVFVMGGNVEGAGVIDGDVAVMGGNIRLLASSEVSGDVTSFGGNATIEDGADIRGDVLDGGNGIQIPFTGDFSSFSQGIQVAPRAPGALRLAWSAAMGILWFAFRLLMMGALAVLVVMFWPEATGRTAEAMVAQPLASGGLGLLTIIAGPPVLLLLIITILLSPISLIGIILLIVAIVFGWIALGMEVGRRMAETFGWDLQPSALAGIGTVTLTLVLGGIGLIPCVGWIPGFVVASLGLGAVMLTRFGSQQYNPAMPPPEPKASGSKKAASK